MWQRQKRQEHLTKLFLINYEIIQILIVTIFKINSILYQMKSNIHQQNDNNTKCDLMKQILNQ
jgi:hypothetical protein